MYTLECVLSRIYVDPVPLLFHFTRLFGVEPAHLIPSALRGLWRSLHSLTAQSPHTHTFPGQKLRRWRLLLIS
jgi:hypothetical protein